MIGKKGDRPVVLYNNFSEIYWNVNTDATVYYIDLKSYK